MPVDKYVCNIHSQRGAVWIEAPAHFNDYFSNQRDVDLCWTSSITLPAFCGICKVSPIFAKGNKLGMKYFFSSANLLFANQVILYFSAAFVLPKCYIKFSLLVG